MDITLLEKVTEQVRKNKKVSLVTVTKVQGVTPAKVGLNMAVFEDKTTIGTVGGGDMEFKVTNKAMDYIKEGKSSSFEYKSDEKQKKAGIIGEVKVEVFIKTYTPKPKLIIVGGGHVGTEIYKLATAQDFYTLVLDSREEYCSKKKFEYAHELHLGNVEKKLKDYDIDENCYIVACGHTHIQDEIVVKTCIDRGAKYIGMLGSTKKIKTIKENLIKQGISSESLEKVYMPIGINIGGDTAKEIAYGILGEIIAVKNNANIEHMRDIKR